MPDAVSEPTTPTTLPEGTGEVASGNGATPAPTPEVKPPSFISDKFAQLARKEKAIVKSRQELSALKADLEKQRSQMAAQQAEFERWQKLKANAKLDPDSYLNEAGLNYGALTERALKGEKFDANEVIAQTRAEIAAFKKEQEERAQKALEENKTTAQNDFQERVKNFVSGINDFVEQNKETYELIDLHSQQDLIWQVIQEGARRKQNITVKEAADKVETYLGQQVEKALLSKKFKDKFMPKIAEEKPKEAGSPTLTNSMTPGTPTTPQYITDQERTQRALAALNKALGE